MQRIVSMRDRLGHRGPDDYGALVDASAGLALGHRRLSILDLSPQGHQPMVSASGRFQLVYNGEVYNFLELRLQLEAAGCRFQGGSDTEVLLAAFEHWGPEQSLTRFNGMFALALWDSHSKRLLLARDRFGKKPLYFGKLGTAWVFASELKGLSPWSDCFGGIDDTALGLYLRYGYVPTPYSIFRGVRKLPAASLVWLDLGDTEPRVERYWRYPTAEPGQQASSEREIERALARAVKLRMVADVPLGAFLSGGIDSSLLVALMQEQSSVKVKTFALGFPTASHDEAGHAKKVAAYLGTDHIEHYVSAQETLGVVPLLAEIYDEPFADPSGIPTFLVSRMARQEVTVALSGDGGDELFGGYNRYIEAPRLWRFLSFFPPGLRRLVAALAGRVPMAWLASLLQNRVAYPEEKMTKLLATLGAASRGELYRRLTSQWTEQSLLISPISAGEPATEPGAQENFAAWMMSKDIDSYLVDDILVKVDRASMAVSLEARAPFLDYELAELAARLPFESKISNGQGKVMLRRLLARRLPQELLARPKAGFSPPVGEWLRGPLRDWAQDLLGQIPGQGILHPKPIQRRWHEHLQGVRDWGYPLWTILSWQAWLQRSSFL